jgi:histidine triad (HIT) family protein
LEFLILEFLHSRIFPFGIWNFLFWNFYSPIMTIFSKIIAGEIPCYKVAENDKFLAFLDIYPSAAGHTLVVPKTEVDRLFDLPDDYLDGYLTFCKPIANAIRRAFGADRVNIITIGFEVAHAHIHLVPMDGMGDADILTHKKTMTANELKAVQEKIIAAMGVGG